MRTPALQPLGSDTFDGSFSCVNDSHWDPYPATEGEFWTALYQRAYLKMTNFIDEGFRDFDYAMSPVAPNQRPDASCVG